MKPLKFRLCFYALIVRIIIIIIAGIGHLPNSTCFEYLVLNDTKYTLDKPHRHCQDFWDNYEVRESGTYYIDPDEDGPIEMFKAYCEMGNEDDPEQVSTIIHHDTEAILNIRGAEAPGSYVRNISYIDVTEQELIALIEVSTHCEQYIKWECKGAMFGFWYPPEVDSWWVGRNWTQQFYWGGAATDSQACGCHPHCKPTERNSTCNCDANDKLAWLADEGLLLDKSRLPVLQLRFGDTGQTNEAGKHTLGPLICQHVAHKDVSMGNYTAPVRITSPGFPSKYPIPFRRYHWDIIINEGDIMELVFPTYDVIHYGAYTSVKECNNVVKVTATREIDSRVITIETQRHFPPYYISDGAKTFIRLTMTTCNQMKNSDSKGIEAVLRKAECEGCEASIGHPMGNIVCSSNCGTIASHRYPYPHQLYDDPEPFNQTWLLIVPKNRIVQLSFNDLDIPTMPGNRRCNAEVGVLFIYNGESAMNNKKIGEFCNLNKRGIVYSKGSKMLIIYRGNHVKVGNGRGFHAIFRAIPRSRAPQLGISKELRNVAKGKPARQSSSVDNYGANLAVDGNNNSIFAAGSCIATNFEKEPWWRVDLQEQHIIYKIKIFNRLELKTLSPRESSAWPRGTYGLPMPYSGCPKSSNFPWQIGMRHHDLDYPVIQDDKTMHWAEGAQLRGGLQEYRGVEQHFCMKVNDDSSHHQFEWMPGKYCIYQYGTMCPFGFQTGFIQWMNRKGNNNNYGNGTLPYGEYNTTHTKIHFCCRHDGDPNDPIRLPTDMPFYLLQYGEECQRVEYMNNIQHYFHFMEDESHILLTSTRFKTPHPKIDVILFEKGFTLYYCYYDITTSLRGFRVVVDNHGLSNSWSRYYDNTYFGIPHSVDEKFGNSYICIDYPVTNTEFTILERNCEQPLLGQFVTLYIYNRFDSLQICEMEIYGKEMCGQPLGMSSEEIKDTQLSATSSENQGERSYFNARLNHRFGWCAANDDPQKYLKVDLGNPTYMSGITVQGLNQATKLIFVWNFTLEFSNDTINWTFEEEPYGKQKIYQCVQCNSKRYKNDIPVTYTFLKHFVARYARFGIVGFEEAPCMRMELFGCRSRDACGRNLTDQTGIIQSPNYPFYYGQDLSCLWTITPPPNKHVELYFILFELARPEPVYRAGSCRDYLTIHLGPNIDPIRSSNGKAFPKSFISNGSMTILLKSCFRSTISRDRGFFATYTFIDCPGCGVGDYSCTDKHPCASSCGYIKSINHPLNYENNHRCRWLIEVPDLHYIVVSFEDFDVIGSENCHEDFVDFYDGNVTSKEYLIGRYCNSHMPPPILYSSWNFLSIEFSSTAKATARGFLLKYKSEKYQLPSSLQKLIFDDPERCDIGWKYYRDHCYQLMQSNEAIQWDVAEAACREYGGHLVSILDRLEMAFVHHLLVNIWKVDKKRIYIGLADKHHDGSFRWQDGNPMSYADWSKATVLEDYPQPNGGPYEGCTVIKLDNIHSTNNWHDVPCSLDRQNGVQKYMCKVKSNITTITNYTFDVKWKQKATSILSKNKLKEHRYFICKSLEVISILYVCDGVTDCRDGSDEQSCGPPIPPSTFLCKDGKRISVSKYCDFEEDCTDGSDEKNCVKRECLFNETRCKNGQCIPQYKWCDLKNDCKDHSDESYCEGKCNHNKTFQCYDGKCIPKSAYCDGSFDCPGLNHEDEVTNCFIGPDVKRSLAGFQTYRRSCYELVVLDNITQSGSYKIDPDLDGPLLPFLVNCVIGSDPRTTKTLIHHDSEERIYTHGEIEVQGSYRRDIIYYYGTWDQLRMLTDISETCQQYVKWECSGVGFHFDNETPISWWVSWDGEAQYYWGGAPENLTCGCYPTCMMSHLRCNCDYTNMNRSAWTEDAGYISNKTKLPVRQIIFGNGYDTGRSGYHTVGPLECFGGINDSQFSKNCIHCENILCNNGLYVPKTMKCIYDIDEYGYMVGCRDVTHLRECDTFRCPSHHFKCPSSYCIPFRFRCNGVRDCPGGHDEMHCSDFTCPGHYRCRKSLYCIPTHQLCDGKQQCVQDDDEALCSIDCPLPCKCEGLYVSCINQNMTQLPLYLSSETRKLDVSYNSFTQTTFMIQHAIELADLCLAHNKITAVAKHLFYSLQNLYSLDLSYNYIETIHSHGFEGLEKLINLNLDGNPNLVILEPGAFLGLNMLPTLIITKSKMSRLEKNSFVGLKTLETLNLTYNLIHTVEEGAFSGLENVKSLDIKGNQIKEFSKNMFAGLDEMTHLFSDSFRFCCLAHSQVDFKNCQPQADEFSSCKDLMSNSILRMFLWFLGIVALIGNLVVIGWRSHTKDVHKVSSLLILSLGCADLLMGVYLLIIASVDVYYRGNYIAYSDHWQESILCRFAGFLSTISSEVSVFTLTFITLDRLICITFPLSMRHINLRTAYTLIIVSWLVAGLIALMPFFVESYFKNEFYARSGVCLALHITNQKPAGWEYSVAIFFCVNFVAFLIIIVSYMYMYYTIKGASRHVNRNQAKKSNENKVGRQMALIVLTNFCCWMPIIIMGLCAMLGSAISGEVYAWTAVFILPLNSATNPVVYTLSSVKFKNMLMRKRRHTLRRNLSVSQAQSGTLLHRIKNGRYSWTYRPPKGYTSLLHFLRTRYPVHVNDVLDIARGLCQALEELHSSGYTLGGFEMDYIFVYKTESGMINVYLPDINAYQTCGPITNTHTEDTAKDIEDFGKIVKKMLQIYHVCSGKQSAHTSSTAC